MNIHKHPSLDIQDWTERFLRRPDFSSLESLLQTCFSTGIVPAKLPLILDEIETRKDRKINYQLYDFIVNRLKEEDSPTTPLVQSLIHAMENLDAQIDDSRERFMSQQNTIKSVGLASYLSYPYLAQTPVFISACKNIDAAIDATFRQVNAPTPNKISYGSSKMGKIRQDIAEALLPLEDWDDKQRLVLISISNSPTQTKSCKLKHNFSGFNIITPEESNILNLSSWNALTKPSAEIPLDILISKYVYDALEDANLTRTGQIKFDANNRTIIGSNGTGVDFDWILTLIQEIGWDTCADLEGFANYGDAGKVAIGNFYEELNDFLKNCPDFLEVRDYQSHLIFKCDLNIADEKPFDGKTSSIGYPLSIFEDGMLEQYFAYATPYRWQISEIHEYNGKRQDIFVSAIEAALSAGYSSLAIDIFIVGLLGYIPFAEELADVSRHTQALVTAITPVLQKNVEVRPRAFESLSGFIKIITEEGSPISKLESLELKTLLRTLGDTYTFEIVSNITPLLASLPFSLPGRIESGLDTYSKECLEQVRWTYNQFLGEKNNLRNEKSGLGMRSISLQHHFHPVWVLTEHLAKKYINQFLASKSDRFGTLMKRLHIETNLPDEKPYQVLCETTGKNRDFFENQIGSMRNWSMHADKSPQKYSADDFEEILNSIFPALLIFFNEIGRK